MTIIHELQSAVMSLPQKDLARFRSWFYEFEAAQWDSQMEKDINDGNLDDLAEKAIDEFQRGEFKEL